MSRKDDIKELILKHQRRLHKLKEQEAIYGLSAPPHILIEIEDIEVQIEQMQIELEKSTKQYDTSSPTEPPLWTRGSPFPGLRAFMLEDAPIFFGRRYETNELLKRLSDPNRRFVAVLGASGSGKSSLIWAGLWPQLNENAIKGSQDWIVIRFTPGQIDENPFKALAVQLEPMLRQQGWIARELANELSTCYQALTEQNSTDRRNLEELCTLALTGKPNWAEIVLFIDQFEELFTFVKPSYRKPFIEMLAHAARSKRIRTIITLRKDFYQKCDEWPHLEELVNMGTFLVSARVLYEMITWPAACADLEFEIGLPERILIDTGRDPGALPLMAYTLDELYRSCQPEGRLTHTAYEEMGRVQDAIGKRAERTFQALDLGDEEQNSLSHVFLHLVQVSEYGVTRKFASLSKVTGTEVAKRLVTELIDARLLVTDEIDEQPTVEVAHEALLSSWPRLTKWIEEMRDDLRLLQQVRIVAREWNDKGRDSVYLWPDERLKPVYAMIKRLQTKLDRVEYQFIRSELKRLVRKELKDPTVDHVRRAAIGERLLVIGDTRRGVGLRPNGLPDIKWCPVPGDKVNLEDRAGIFDVKPFYVAKFPITYVQFQAFLEDPEGYANNFWWEGLINRESGPKNQRLKLANHPRENVKWHEAVAYCRWLTKKYKDNLESSPDLLPLSPYFPTSDWRIRLPTEWEWQQAASGGNPNNIYPWGKEQQGIRANTRESGLNRVVAVGMYPQGISPIGAMDMIGNIWEWCSNEHEIAQNTGTLGNANRASRGGSFGQALTRASFRVSHPPNYRYDEFVGFRVAYGECP